MGIGSRAGVRAGEDAGVHLDIQPECPGDHEAIREVVFAAFDQRQEVVRLVDLIRESPGFVPELSLVARRDGQTVGHVMISHAELVDEVEERRRILMLSPLAVAPVVQRQGIGSALVRAALAAADGLGEGLVVLEGSPDYYSRLGFRDCRTVGVHIDLPDWSSRDAGQAYLLSAYDEGLRGRVVHPPAFATLG
jgi:putative acetyltransferase